MFPSHAHDPPPNDHLAYEELVVEQVFVIGPADDPLLKRGRLTRQAFNNLPTAIVPLGRNRFPPGRMRAPRVLAVPRARPVSCATREVAAALKRICAELIAEGKIVPAAWDGRPGGRRRSRR